MLIGRTSQMNGLAGFNYAGLRWGALLQQAQRDHAAQWGMRDSFDPYSGGSTSIAGKAAQIYLAPMPDAFTSQGDLRPGVEGDGALFGLPGHVVLFNLHDPEYVGPDGTTEWMLQLSRGAGDAVVVTPYKIDDGIPWMALMMMATPFILPGGIGGGLFGGAGATTGAVEAVGWTSGYDLSMGADFLSMTGAGSAGVVGADLYANEMAKLLQQQSLAQAGVDLLPTTLETINLGTAATGFGLDVGWAEALKQAGTTLGTVSKAATLATMLTSGGSSSGTRTALPRTTQQQVYPQQVPQVTTQYVHAAPADEKTMMIGLGIGAAVLALVLLRG